MPVLLVGMLLGGVRGEPEWELFVCKCGSTHSAVFAYDGSCDRFEIFTFRCISKSNFL